MIVIAPILAAVAAALPETGPGEPDLPGAAGSMTLGEVLQFELVGFVIVVGTLTLLWLVCEAIGLWFKRAARRAVAPAAAVEAAQPAAPAAPPVVAIAAAVAAVCQQRRHRIVAIRPANQLWSHVGRREHFQSHRIR